MAFLALFFPHEKPMITAMDAAATTITRSTRNALDPKPPSAPAVSVVTLVRVCVTVVVVVAVWALTIAWPVKSTRVSKHRRALPPKGSPIFSPITTDLGERPSWI